MTIAMRIAAVLVVIAAVWAGKYVVSLVFHAAGVPILTGYPAGIAVILGVKTLARYAELKSQPTPGTGAQEANEESSAAIEQFIIGTMASALWAVLLALATKALWR
ncbi:MAG: hypothetical protein E6924_12675 [Cutibacterium avidum]|nr:hypothetical protein [Cutibacterium avidum]